MTSKDLNLNLSPEQRSRGGKGRARLASAPAGKKPAEAVPIARAKNRPKRQKPRRQASRTSPLLACTFVIALVNLLFMGMAAYWLYLNFDRIPLAGAASPQAMNPGLEQALKDINLDMRALDGGMQELQAALLEQQQLVTSALRDVDAQLAAQLIERERAAVAAEALRQKAVVATQPAPDAWVINASTYSDLQMATLMMKKLLDLGYEARVSPASSGGQKSHRVLVSGYTERPAAEQAAKRIMEQTDLNGLWVSRDE